MKRILAILLFASCAVVSNAQFHRGDTLLWGQRWPSYYYWGDNWIDRQYNPSNISGLSGNMINPTRCKPEMARYNYADSSLRVIGVAVGLSFTINIGWNDPPNMNYFSNYQTDYIRLYEVDSTTNELVLLAEKPLDTNVVCYLPDYLPLYGSKPHVPVREAFFDSAITVYDSFYVSVTSNNNYHSSRVTTGIHAIHQLINNKPACFPNPNHYRRKLHKIETDVAYHITDTNWHVFHTDSYADSYSMEDPNEWSYFMMIFPIIDTTYNHSWVPECKRPTGFGAIHVGREVVVLGWESEGSSQWELKVAKEGTGLDSVEALGCTNDVMPLYELDTASWYVATVRSICGQNRISEWSDTIRFFVPGDTTSTDPTDPTEGISNVVERYTYLMPNPASGQVSVMSSFRIDRVEIYTLAGQRILQENAAGLSAQIDISALAQGTYIVRTYTNRGVSNKRLVVR